MNHDKVQKWDDVCLATCIFPSEVGKKTFIFLHLGGYLFSMGHGNKYLPGGKSSKENVLLLMLGMYLSLDR